MAARFTIYCQRSAADLTTEDLLDGVNSADLQMIAEGFDVPDDVVESALEQLRINNLKPRGFLFYRLSYRPDGRQIDIERWETAEEVQGVISELMENLAEPERLLLNRIESHCKGVVDIVTVSFGSSEQEQMAPALASEVARWLAEQFKGIIRAPDHTWWQLGVHGEYQAMKA